MFTEHPTVDDTTDLTKIQQAIEKGHYQIKSDCIADRLLECVLRHATLSSQHRSLTTS